MGIRSKKQITLLVHQRSIIGMFSAQSTVCVAVSPESPHTNTRSTCRRCYGWGTTGDLVHTWRPLGTCCVVTMVTMSTWIVYTSRGQLFDVWGVGVGVRGCRLSSRLYKATKALTENLCPLNTRGSEPLSTNGAHFLCGTRELIKEKIWVRSLRPALIDTSRRPSEWQTHRVSLSLNLQV